MLLTTVLIINGNRFQYIINAVVRDVHKFVLNLNGTSIYDFATILFDTDLPSELLMFSPDIILCWIETKFDIELMTRVEVHYWTNEGQVVHKLDIQADLDRIG